MEENNEMKKEIVKNKIPKYVYIVGIVVVLLLILIIALIISINCDEEVPVEEPKVEEKDSFELTEVNVKKYIMKHYLL